MQRIIDPKRDEWETRQNLRTVYNEEQTNTQSLTLCANVSQCFIAPK